MFMIWKMLGIETYVYRFKSIGKECYDIINLFMQEALRS